MPSAFFIRDLLPSLPSGKEWLAVSHGESGDSVYRRSDGAAFAKISQDRGALALEGERRPIEWLSRFDLGSPQMLDWRIGEEGACLITSAVPGVPASDLDGRQLLQAWPSIAARIGALHALAAEDCPFERGLSTMLARAADVVSRGAVNPDFLRPEQQETDPADLLLALEAEREKRLAEEAGDRVVCHGDACMPNFMVDPATLRCTGMIDLGRLGTADRYVDLALMLANAGESWSGPDQAQAAFASLFEVLGLERPDRERLDFYLSLDPLTWG
ncbi:APH(3'') family aminoglycoside O-phosphotransferase [Labrys okinawensis]|uniref:Aminoglycoside 3'-phosphotransferase n=1 Tax=Labrys okinawensis TaxID=346911 RepID=A0A2S9QHZ7_9HYPH|nr:APH(3'') family aminoglycoside O-phosphotransferase [Labrys okinawensis]PRH88986.1 APH(3'') family aminoglycoside O-phosphotransferase [Labrys okinawensis]